MLIEVGKKYINAIGEVVEIVEELEGNSRFFYADNNGEAYTKTGMYFVNRESERDLICLVDEDLLKQYEANEITQKEFIAKHIELYTGEKL